MNKTIKERIGDEQATLWYCWHNYNNYYGVTNIEEFGKIRLVYNKIETGHKARAKRLFDDLLADTKSKLPTWVIEYFYVSTFFRTFDAWQKHGRVVKKGARSFMKNKEGIALFAEDQTVIPDHTKRAREKLMEAIYDANDDASSEEYDVLTDYDEINKELQGWHGVSLQSPKKTYGWHSLSPQSSKKYNGAYTPEYEEDKEFYGYEQEW